LLIVSDTSALSALARMGWLEWLQERWEQVVAPEAVWRELGLIGDAQAAALLQRAKESGWLTIRKPTNIALIGQLQTSLDPGESEAIALAMELGADAVMLDEMDGRNAARELWACPGLVDTLRGGGWNKRP
jgi:predicted nucleic acid-binding protein